MKQRNTSPLAVLFFSLLYAASCASTPRPIPSAIEASDNPQAEAAYRDARAAFDAGQLDAADSALSALMDAYPRDPLAGSARLLRAQIALAQGAPQRARELLRPLLVLDSPTAERARFYDAVALHRVGESAAAYTALLPFVGRLTDEKDNELLREQLIAAATAMGKPTRAIGPLAQLLGYDPPESIAADLRQDIDQCLAAVKRAEELRFVLESLPPKSEVAARVAARYARLCVEEGDLDTAKRALEQAVEAGHGALPAIVALLSELSTAEEVDFSTIGCILPMTGRSKLVGEQALRGVMLGADRVELDDDGNHMAVLLRDDGGDPEKARAAVAALVQDEKVAAIIGPLDASSATAAAEEAERLGVPLLVLSSRENLVETTTALRLFTSHRAEVAALLDRAQAADAQRVVLLVPDSEYGKLISGLALEEATSRSLQPPTVVSYSKDATAFSDVARKVAGLSPEAVLLADSASKVALIAPALASQGLWSTMDPGTLPPGAVPIALLVTSPGWSTELPRRAGRYLQGAVFVGAFVPTASSSGEAFAALYADEYAAAPQFIAAYAHDAAVLLGAALRFGPGRRGAIRDWLVRSALAEAPALPLALPFGGFEATTGEPMTTPVLLRLEGSAFTLSP